MEPQDPERFLRWLFIEAKNPEQLVKSMFWHTFDFQDVPLSKLSHQSTEYTLMLSRTPMSHGDKNPNLNGLLLVFQSDKIAHTAKTTLLHNASAWKTLHIPASTNAPNPVKAIEAVPSMNTSNPVKGIEAILLPLGWLVESGTKQGCKFKRITNYTVLLNISTDPISLWLAYDYYPTIDLDMTMAVQLSNSQYFNPNYHCRNPKPALHNATDVPKNKSEPSSCSIREKILQASGLEACVEAHQPIGIKVDLDDLPFIARREILEKYQHLFLSKDKNELFSSTEEEVVKKQASYLLDRKDVNDVLDEEERQMLHSYVDANSTASYLPEDQQETIQEPEKDESSTTQVEERASHTPERDNASVPDGSPRSNRSKDSGYGSEANDISRNTGESPKTIRDTSSLTESDKVASDPKEQDSLEERGFFDLSEKFDVALVARDIGDWTKEGFIWSNVRECLQSSMLHIGSTLHARALPKGPKGTLIRKSQFLFQKEES